jgi:hypothetical protein
MRFDPGLPFCPNKIVCFVFCRAMRQRVQSHSGASLRMPIYSNSGWCKPSIGDSYEFPSQPSVCDLDSWTFFFYHVTGVTPAMASKLIGVGGYTPPRFWTQTKNHRVAARLTSATSAAEYRSMARNL